MKDREAVRTKYRKDIQRKGKYIEEVEERITSE